MNSFVQVVDYYNTKMYLSLNHIVRVDETGLSDNCVIVYMTLEKPKDSIVLRMPEWESIKSMLGIAQLPLPGPADDLKPSTTTQWSEVDSVEKATFYSSTSRSHRDMWRLRTTDGRQVNLFDHSDPLRDQKHLLQESDYWELFRMMDEGQIDRWTVSPIKVELVADGAFWKVIRINTRPDGANPDFTDDSESEQPLNDLDEDEIEMFPAVPTDLQELVALVKRGNFVILDTETTGLGDKAEICSIAIIDEHGKTLLDTLVRPVRGIPADATRIHGITNDMVKGAGGWLKLNGQVWDLLYGRDVIVYNADYDFRLLMQTEKACDPFAVSDWSTISRVCAMNAYAEHVGDWNEYHDNYKWHKLTDAASAAGFHLPEGMKPHSAVADCHMTLAVCRFLAGQDES